ncbi:MAG: copper transporter [Acidimicrobiia bacterium]
MINFRFHLASLVAIFLALALGVVIGAGVIDRGVVDALDNRINTVETKADKVQAENDRLVAAAEENANVVAAMGDHAVNGRLVSSDVGVIAVRGVDDDPVNETVDDLQQAGARATGVLWLESPWKLDDKEQIAALADAIGSSSRRPTVLREQAWQQITRQLLVPHANTSTSTTQGEGSASSNVLVALRDAGFVTFDQVDGQGSIDEFAGNVPMIALMVGNDTDVPASDVVMPAANALTAVGIPLVVGADYVIDAQPPSSRGDDLTALRDSPLSTRVSTVNDLDRPQGPVTVVLALADLLRDPPVVGHYGIGANTVLMPEPLPS